MSDPRRLRDASSRSSAAMRELLRAGRTDLPDADRLDGIEAGLAGFMGLVAGPVAVPPPLPPSVGPPVSVAGAGGAGTAGAGAAGGAGTAAAGLKMAAAMKVAVVVASVGAAAGGVYAGSRASRIAPAPATVAIASAANEIPRGKVAAPPVVAVTPPSATLASPDVALLFASPAVAAPPFASPAVASPAVVPPAVPPLDEARPAAAHAAVPTESELSILEGAQDHLAIDPAASLADAERHRARFPRGALAQEREVIAIEALVRMQRLGEARARALRFDRDFPNSAHRARIEALLSSGPGPVTP